MIDQNSYLRGMRLLRDSGSQFKHKNCFFMDHPVKLNDVIAKCRPFVHKILNQSLHH